MTRPHIYVNLPVEDLDRSVRFFTALGFRFNPQFTDENATAMIIGEDSFVMLLVRPFFQTFTRKPLGAPVHVGAIIALSQPDRDAVDAIVAKAETDTKALIKRREKMAEDKIGAAERSALATAPAAALDSAPNAVPECR